MAIVVSVIFGVLGYVSRDGVQIANYILSSQNLNSDDPLLFTSKNDYLTKLIEECVNKEGSFLSTIEDDILTYQEELEDYFEEELLEIYNNTCNNNTRDSLVKYYQSLYNATTTILDITITLYNIKCRFAKNDKNIIINELESAGKRATALSTFQFLVAIFLAISVLAGIFLVHKYRRKSQDISLNKDSSITPSSSRDAQVNTTKSFEYLNNGNK